MKDERGFVSFTAITVLLILSMLLAAESAYFFGKQKKVLSYKKMYERKEKALKILSAFENDMQCLKSDLSDSETSSGIMFLKDKYREENIQIKDVSTGINESFLPKEFVDKKEIQDIQKRFKEEVKSEYGWFNARVTDKKTLMELHKEFEGKELYPLLNGFPSFNINYMNVDFIEAVCSICGIKEKETDILRLYEENPNHKVFDYIGFKTSFWQVELETDFYKVSAVFAALPEKNSQRKVSCYVPVEKHIESKGGLKW